MAEKQRNSKRSNRSRSGSRIGPVAAAVLCMAGGALARQARLAGNVSAWLFAGYDSLVAGEAGLRYVPILSVKFPVAGTGSVGGEASVNGAFRALSSGSDTSRVGYSVEPYRVWMNFSLPRFEARAGLQNIEFGSATILRPQAWFVRIDPRDPLALADGVYGLLCRCYLLNNANIWLWTLVGNSVPKGWEYIPTDRWSPEAGGRLQVPVPRGEIAVAANYRRTDIGRSGLPGIPETARPAAEERVGIDGKWDLGVGVSIEGSIVRLGTQAIAAPWQKALMAGLDYTFAIGHGLGMIAEHLFIAATARSESFENGNQFSAFVARYPLGIVDQVRAIVVVDWTNRGLYRYFGWQRTYDAWSFVLSAFWNPARPGPVAGSLLDAAPAATGLQFMVVFNH